MIVPAAVRWTETDVPARRAPDSQAKAPDGAWLREMEQQQARQWLPSSGQLGLGGAAVRSPFSPQPLRVSMPGRAIARSGAETPQTPANARHMQRSQPGTEQTTHGPEARGRVPDAEPTPSATHSIAGEPATAPAPGFLIRPAPTPGATYRPPVSDGRASAVVPDPRIPLPAGAWTRVRTGSPIDDLAARLELELHDVSAAAGAGKAAFATAQGSGPRIHVSWDGSEANLWLGLDAPSGEALAQAALLLPALRRHLEALGHRLGRVTCNGTVVHDGAGIPPPQPAFEGMLSVFRNPAGQERP